MRYVRPLSRLYTVESAPGGDIFHYDQVHSEAWADLPWPA